MAAQPVGVCQINYSVSNENLGRMITFRGRTRTWAVDDCVLLLFIYYLEATLPLLCVQVWFLALLLWNIFLCVCLIAGHVSAADCMYPDSFSKRQRCCSALLSGRLQRQKRPVQSFASSLWINVLTDVWKLMQGKHKTAVGKRQWAEEYGRYSLAPAGVFAHGKLVICLKLNLNINSGTRYLPFIHTVDAQCSSALRNIPFRLWLCPTPQATTSICHRHNSLCMWRS